MFPILRKLRVRKPNIVGWGGQTTQHFRQHFKTIEVLGEPRIIFDLSQTSSNIENKDVVCPNKVVKQAEISADIMLCEMFG